MDAEDAGAQGQPWQQIRRRAQRPSEFVHRTGDERGQECGGTCLRQPPHHGRPADGVNRRQVDTEVTIHLEIDETGHEDAVGQIEVRRLGRAATTDLGHDPAADPHEPGREDLRAGRWHDAARRDQRVRHNAAPLAAVCTRIRLLPSCPIPLWFSPAGAIASIRVLLRQPSDTASPGWIAGSGDAELLRLPGGGPVLVLQRRSFAAGTCVELAVSTHRADHYQLRATLESPRRATVR